MKNFSVAVRSAAIATVAALGLSLGAGAANAQPALPEMPNIPIPGLGDTGPKGVKQIVTFGDSFTANAGKGGPRGLAPGQNALVANCATDMENWPKIAASKLDKSLGDWSCNGLGGFPGQLLAYLEASIQYGDIGEGTEKVVLMYGGMDWVQWVDVAGELVAKPDPQAPSAFKQTLRQFTDRVHQVAPGAQVVLASYPEYATNDQLCLVNTSDQTFPIPAPGGSEIQGAFRDSIRSASQHVGAGFIDVYEATLGHGTCNPNPDERFVAGFADPVMGPMTNHPTVAGEKAMGNIIADQLY